MTEISMLRQVQLKQLEIAKEIKKVCDENEINYFLDSGTLLGAVRHKGFIPWDDDLDIGMLRDDYEKFINIAPQKLSNNFILQTWKTDEEYANAFAKIRMKNTLYIESSTNGNNMNHGIFIDVFPYDTYPNKKYQRFYQGIILTFYKRILKVKCNYFNPKIYNFTFIGLIKKTTYYLLKGLSFFLSKNQLIKSHDKCAKKYNGITSEFYYEQTGGTPYGKWLVPRECFDKYIDLQFEDTIFSCPFQHDLYLTSIYGNYMQLPPKEERYNKHEIIKIEIGE